MTTPSSFAAPGGKAAGASPPETVTEFVVEQLRDRIVLGRIQPGQKLSVYSLAEEFGVSRVPLREAVRQLEAECLVDNLPRRGTVVRPLNMADITDAYQIFERIEVIAAQRAATGDDATIGKEMRYWLDTMATLTEQGAPGAGEQMLHAHRAFHFAMFRGAGEGVLQRHLRMLWNTCERYVIKSRTPERQLAAAREHDEIARQIEARDPDAVAAALAVHLHASMAGTMETLRTMGIAESANPG
ncbi:GntR family transcriptional regulator [Mycobacterium sp. NPDC003449]